MVEQKKRLAYFSTIQLSNILEKKKSNKSLSVFQGKMNQGLVEIGLTDLPKSGCAMAHPAHPGTTGLRFGEGDLQFFLFVLTLLFYHKTSNFEHQSLIRFHLSWLLITHRSVLNADSIEIISVVA